MDKHVVMVLRQLLAVAALPMTVTVLVPLWLGRRYGLVLQPPAHALEWAAVAAGLAASAIGLALFAASLSRFITQGKGTLAPWDPPRHLVVTGPYRYVRNPMISGVAFILAGEALLLRAPPHVWWAALFILINVVYIASVEEPQLERRFGDDYRTYCRHVPRVVPRRTPWQP